MDSAGEMKQTDAHARRSGRQSSKRPREDDAKDDAKVARSESSAASILATFELHDCTQVCRAFMRGRCLKSNDASLPPSHYVASPPPNCR